jgi:Kef-type K+ transport system membrane component KefB
MEISELLTIMAFAAFLANSDQFVTARTKKNLELLNPVLLPFFFIFAGARLNIQLIGEIGLIGLLYTGARMAGKIGGASLGAVIGKASAMVKKWIGFSLIPQVGVAVALALAVNQQFGKGGYGAEGIQLANIVINILLFTTIITEIVGPILTRAALKNAGEIEND